ncbi:PAS domain-containing protein [Winogradskyella echinorum]|uniref:PAS domain-containing protein n=1 Tax=Winogradskyella echinorum TaxID=538189 RepID=A0ABR6Y1L4_9FLAO|nr:LuxR C-terminal-related transcriptional regulator [Winogradskyella echinorum]MBC3846153.1 PAS domain-containing protein [Winogradskyella echinorum]MBC5750501.1 PAS domain-containing protein [Winogradskyella echinorum]
MNYLKIKEIYRFIFQSYDKPFLQKHIEKIIEMDTFLPYSSTFFCITNTQDLSFEFISKNYKASLGLNPNELKENGMRYFWNRIHPDDVDAWLKALNKLMEFTLNEIPVEKRQDASYTWNFRFKNAQNVFVNIVQNTTPLIFDSENKPIIGLAHYTVLHPDVKLDITASAKLLNDKQEYETIYFDSFSQKLLHDGVTNRERDIIRLLILDKSSKEISEKLNISPHTVDTHRRNILKKLEISSTGELVGILKLNPHWL